MLKIFKMVILPSRKMGKPHTSKTSVGKITEIFDLFVNWQQSYLDLNINEMIKFTIVNIISICNWNHKEKFINFVVKLNLYHFKTHRFLIFQWFYSKIYFPNSRQNRSIKNTPKHNSKMHLFIKACSCIYHCIIMIVFL